MSSPRFAFMSLAIVLFIQTSLCVRPEQTTMISNTSDVPTLAGGFINIDMVKRPTDIHNRRSKIICTLGPACWEVPQLEKLIDAGMNVARFNFSHGSHEGHLACLERLHEAAANKNRNIAVLMDTKGPEIRSGFFAGGVDKIELKKGESIILTSDYTFKGDCHKLAVSYPSLAKSVNPGQQILVADGSLVLTVLSTDVPAGEITCRIENNAAIGERKNCNLPGVKVDLETFTDKDKDDIVNWGIKHNVDFIAASFVRKGEDVRNLRKLLADNGGQKIKIICKIENLEGLENYGDILEATDGIMVARGDLGMEIPPAKVFLAQKLMIREANIAGKPVVTATQMMESMITNPRPTRAECSDVANAIYDGTDVVMLSGETANSPYFEQAVKVMARTCREAESSRNYNMLFQSVRNSVKSRYQLTAGESLASSAVKTAIDIGAKFMIVMSETGRSARNIAKFRPGIPVICLTPDPTVSRQTSGVLMSVHSYVVDSLENTDSLIREASHQAVKAKLARDGDSFIVVCGTTFGKGANDQIKVEYVKWDASDAAKAASAPMSPMGHMKAGFTFPQYQ